MIVFDDIETRSSSFKSPIVEERIQRLIEAYKSCKEDGIMLGFGNDLHPDCAANKLLKEQRKGVKRDFIAVHPFPDWSYGKTGEVPYKGSVWPERYPAETEKEMRKMHRITDDIEWSQAQCDPKLKSGHIFPALYYNEYRPEDLPKNIYGVAYCDQNHARKNAGDTTAMGALLFDSATRTYYAVDLKCRSYADPNMLLSDYLKIYKDNICLMGMDGNVSQESTWEAHIVSWCYKNKKDFPPVLFKRYNVDALTTAAQIIYMGGRVLFPAGFKDTEEGQEFFKQFHSFEGKKAGNTDDAADWFICCLNLGFEEGFFDNSEGIEEDFKVVKIDSPFSF
jgi:hypothetical protein